MEPSVAGSAPLSGVALEAFAAKIVESAIVIIRDNRTSARGMEQIRVRAFVLLVNNMFSPLPWQGFGAN
jgi:hypothetical protein